MASPPEPGRNRHVGRVVDPSVREDGAPEPELTLEAPELEPESPAPRAAEAGGSPADGARTEPEPEIERGGRMRARLLERARKLDEEEAALSDRSLGDLDEIGQAPPRASELDDSEPSLRPPGAPLAARDGGRLSPSLVALFGTLMGIAIVASLSVVIGQLTPRGALPQTETAATAATPSAAPAPPSVVLVKKPARHKQPGPWRISDAAADGGSRIGDGKVGSDAFLTAVQKIGVSQRDAYRLVAAFKSIKSFDKCAKQDRLVALIDRGSSRLKAFEYVAGPEEVFQAREGTDGLLKGAKLDLKLERGEVQGSLVYDGTSFDASAERAGFDPGLSKVVAKALDGHVALDELERGDVVRVLAQEVSVLGTFARYSGIEAVEVRRAGKEQPLRVYFFDAGGERGYFDAQGRAPYEGGWRKPIPTAPMTSPYNLKRLHPILKKVMPHLGIDFGAASGTPVGASSFGTVSFVAYAGATGNLVKIEHAGGIETGYAHLSRFAEGLKVGDKVHRLQLIGYVGSTGRSTGPHLHFSAKKNGEFIDPASLNLDGMRTVSKDQRAAFDAVTARYNTLLDALPVPPALEPLAPRAAPEGSAAPPAAPAAAGAGDPGVEEGDSEEAPGAAPPAAAAPAAAAPAAAPAQPAAQPGSGKPSIYLSDKELQQMQGASDDGEVSE